MGSSKKDFYNSFQYFAVSFPAEYVAHVEVNRPEKLNAFSEPMFHSLGSIFRELSTDPDVRCVILSGKGDRGFTVGLDVTQASSSRNEDTKHNAPDVARRAFAWRKHILELQEPITHVDECKKPVICVMHGYALGGAIDISCACDIRLCASNTVFSIREAAIGLAADLGTLSRIPKLGISHSWIKELALTARDFSAEEALKFGFVSGVEKTKDDTMKKAMQMAQQITKLSPVAVEGTKRVLDFSREHQVKDGLEYVAIWNAAMLQSEDVSKAMTSGLKRQTPTFSKL